MPPSLRTDANIGIGFQESKGKDENIVWHEQTKALFGYAKRAADNGEKEKGAKSHENLAPILAPMRLIDTYKGIFSAPLGTRT